MLDKARVRRPEAYKELMQSLCKGDHAVFDTYADLLVFAAVLGQSRSETEAFSKTAEPVAMNIFSGRFDMTVFNTLAVNSQGNDPTIMSKDNVEAKIKIFEEYAHGGLKILDNILKNSSEEDQQEPILNLLLRSNSENKVLSDITGLA